MSEVKLTSVRRFAIFLKKWGIKTLEFLVKIFAYFAIFFFRILTSILYVIVVTPFMFVTIIVLGVKRGSYILDEISKSFKKFPL